MAVGVITASILVVFEGYRVIILNQPVVVQFDPLTEGYLGLLAVLVGSYLGVRGKQSLSSALSTVVADTIKVDNSTTTNNSAQVPGSHIAIPLDTPTEHLEDLKAA